MTLFKKDIKMMTLIDKTPKNSQVILVVMSDKRNMKENTKTLA